MFRRSNIDKQLIVLCWTGNLANADKWKIAFAILVTVVFINLSKPPHPQRSVMNGDSALDSSVQSNDTVNFTCLSNAEECPLPGATRYLVGVYKTATEQVRHVTQRASNAAVANFVFVGLFVRHEKIQNAN